MEKLSYLPKGKQLSATLERKSFQMPRKRKSKQEYIAAEESFENLQLKKRNKELEKQLKDAESNCILYNG